MPRTSKQYEEIRQITRDKIIESALVLFAQKGFHGTSISDIAQNAGISKGLAYNYFDSKQHLLEAIFSDMIKMGKEVLEGMEDISDPYEQLQLTIKRSFDFVEREILQWRLYISMVFQVDIFPSSLSITKDFTGYLFKVFEKLFKKMGFRNAAMEAMFFSATVDGMMLYYLIDSKSFPIKKVKKEMLKRYSREEIKKRKSVTQ